MQLFDIALKDLLQIIRDRKSVIFLVLMPIVFTLFFGFIMSGSISDPRLPVGWIKNDGIDDFSTELTGKLESSDVVRIVQMEFNDVENVSSQVREEKLAAAVIVPDGFTDSIMTGEVVPLTLIVLPGSTAGSTASTEIEAAVNQLISTVVISKLSAESFEVIQPFQNPESRNDYLAEGQQMANQAWLQPAFSVEDESDMGNSSSSKATNKGFLQSSPGMMVQFAILGLTTCSMVLYLERKSRTLERMLTTPVQRVNVIAGHILGVFFIVFLQEVLLVSLGQLVFGVDYLRVPFGTLLMMVALALWAACLGLMIGVIAKVADQVILFSLIAMFLFSALGGAWFPLEIAGETFSTIGHFTPAAWAMDGFQNIVMRGQNFTSTLLPAGIVTLYSVLFFVIAIWRFRSETKNGK